MSLGGQGSPDDPLALAVDAAVEQGIVVVAAAGNAGPNPQTIGSPGVARKAFTVGATDKSDYIASSSSRGPVEGFDELIKPEIVAPGVDINSTVPTSGQLGSPSRYGSLSGTSMAAPHVAGTAALIKQLRPTWTPALIEANLMNTTEDLGLNILAQGAGRVQVDHAAAAMGVLSPGSLGLGIVDTNQPVWTQTRTLRLTNVLTTPVSYSLWVSGSLPSSVATHLDPSSATIGPGESITATFRITVDNAAVSDTGSAQGHIVAQAEGSAAEPLRVPFTFFRSSSLEMTFGETPSYVLVHDRSSIVARREYLDFGNSAQPTSLSLMLPSGIYDVVVVYLDNPVSTAPMVIREGVRVYGTTNLDIRRGEALHTVALSLKDKNGGPITKVQSFQPFNLTQRLVHIKSGISFDWYWSELFGKPNMARQFSDFSGDYVWEWRITMGWQGDWYEFNGTRTGIAGDSTYQNDPSAFRHLVYQFHPEPTRSLIGVTHVASVKPDGCYLRASAFSETLSSPFIKHAYYMPFADSATLLTYSYAMATVPGSNPVQVLNASPHILVKADGSVEQHLNASPKAFYLGNLEGSQVHLGLAPPSWFGKFTNSASQITLKPALSSRSTLIHYQDWDRPRYDPLAYQLYQGGTVVNTGTLPAVTDAEWNPVQMVAIGLPPPEHILSSSPMISIG